MGTWIPEGVLSLLRRAYPSADFEDVSAHSSVMAQSGIGPRVEAVVGELRSAHNLVPLVIPPVEGRIYYEINVTRYRTPSAHGAHVEYVGLGILLVSALGAVASYRNLRGVPTANPASTAEFEDAERHVKTALAEQGISLLPWDVLNATVPEMGPAQLDKRLYVPTVHLCLFRRLF